MSDGTGIDRSEDPPDDDPGVDAEAAETSNVLELRQQGALLRAGDTSGASLTTAPTRIVVETRHTTPVVFPRSMTWTPRQLLSVLVAVGLIASAGLVAGWVFGGGVQPNFAARSEFIYYLDESIPDGFLREDRRILTQLVTIEGETVLGPVAEQFDVPTDEIADAIDVSVVELSEVIRLDVVDEDPAWALAVNEAVLGRYRQVADSALRRPDTAELVDRRDEVLDDLDAADAEALVISQRTLDDVVLQAREEALVRDLDLTVQRVDRLSGLEDSLLTETTTVDDRASLQSQLTAARQQLAQLEAELLAVRSARSQLEIRIDAILASEVPFVDPAEQSQLVQLGVREDSVSREIDTVSRRIGTLEGLLAETQLNQQSGVDAAPIEGQLALAQADLAAIEEELVEVRTERATLAQEAAALPSLTRRIERLEQDLDVAEAQLAEARLAADAPSPIEVLVEPLVLDEPVGNPRLQWAALGLLASLPVAAVVGWSLRRRQRRQN